MGNPLVAAAAIALLASSTRALSSWYTVPGSNSPAGSTPGDKIRGVNLGGWFVLEPWMQPSLFNASPLDQQDVLDEWTYTSVLNKSEAISRLTAHWSSWIVENDFSRMADYGLNTVRIPVGYWVFNKTNEEPWVGQGDGAGGEAPQMQYLEQALVWADEYGMDVILDMHGAVGSQSGQDNSGRKGDVQFGWNSTTIDRTVNAMGKMVAWATQEKFNGVVKSYELLNEPYIQAYQSYGMSWDTLVSYLAGAYAAVRANEIIPSGGHPAMVMIHDCFQPLSNWDYFFSTDGSTWINYALDTHIYQAFADAPNMSDDQQLMGICGQQSSITTSQSKLPTVVGEFSLGTETFCVDYKSCAGKTMNDQIAGLGRSNAFQRQFWEVQKDVYELGAGWIFWNWKTELAPTWSYEQAVAQDWIPVDPTEVLYPFYTSTSWCLDINNPIDGDQNIPEFYSFARAIAAGTHLPKQEALVTANATAVAISATSVLSNARSTAPAATSTSSTSAGNAASSIASATSAVASAATSVSATSTGTRGVSWAAALLLIGPLLALTASTRV